VNPRQDGSVFGPISFNVQALPQHPNRMHFGKVQVMPCYLKFPAHRLRDSHGWLAL